MKKMLNILMILPFLTATAFSQSDEIVETISGLKEFSAFINGLLPEIDSYFMAIMVSIMILLRGLAEVLNLIAKKTETKLDDNAAAWLSKILRYASAAVGWFGIGSPKR